MPLEECIRKHTYRQMLTWMAYLGEEWNQPDRSDHYLMQIAMEVRRVLHKNPSSVKLDDMKIPFDPVHTKDGKVKRKVATPEEREEATRVAKVAWGMRLGSATKKIVSKIPMGKRND